MLVPHLVVNVETPEEEEEEVVEILIKVVVILAWWELCSYVCKCYELATPQAVYCSYYAVYAESKFGELRNCHS